MRPTDVLLRGVTSLVAVLVAASLTVPTAAAEPQPASTKGGYAIGDSVMLGAKSQLKRRGFTVNATVCSANP